MKQIALFLLTLTVFLSVQAQNKDKIHPELNNTFKVREETEDSDLKIITENQMYLMTDGGGDSKSPGNLNEAIELNNRGVENFLEKKYDKALDYFRQAVLKSPESVPIQTNLANALLDNNYYSEAAEICRKLIGSNDAKSGGIYAILGSALYEMEYYTESVTFFQKALEFEKQNAGYYNNLGIALYRAENKQSALAAFENALKYKFIFPEALNNYGVTLVKIGRYKEAAQKFEQAIKQKPEFAKAFNNLGVVFSHIGKKKQAKKSFLEAVRLKPEWSNAQYNLAMSYLAEGNRQEAGKCLKILQKLDAKLAQQFQREFYRDYIIDASEKG
jgi:tetratricopeptide (TPR) repeat protein